MIMYNSQKNHVELPLQRPGIGVHQFDRTNKQSKILNLIFYLFSFEELEIVSDKSTDHLFLLMI